jgi:hypothetical protein
MRPLLRLLALVAALQLIGGHWVMLQTTAWVGMVVDFSKASSVTEAVSKTLSGMHPCKLCHAVKTGQSEEKKRELSKTTPKAEAVLLEHPPMPLPTFIECVYPDLLDTLTSRTEAPPHRPPLV